MIVRLEAKPFEQSSDMLKEVDGIDVFIENFGQLNFPNQMISVLEDSLFQKFVALMPNDDSLAKFDHWLSLLFHAQILISLEDPDSSDNALGVILQKALEYSRHSKVSVYKTNKSMISVFNSVGFVQVRRVFPRYHLP